jgi:hypothetical protein
VPARCTTNCVPRAASASIRRRRHRAFGAALSVPARRLRGRDASAIRKAQDHRLVSGGAAQPGRLAPYPALPGQPPAPGPRRCATRLPTVVGVAAAG